MYESVDLTLTKQLKMAIKSEGNIENTSEGDAESILFLN